MGVTAESTLYGGQAGWVLAVVFACVLLPFQIPSSSARSWPWCDPAPVSTTTGCNDMSISLSNQLNISLSILNSTTAFIFHSCQGSSSGVNTCASANSVGLLHAFQKKKAHVGQSSFCCPVHSLHGSALELTYTHTCFFIAKQQLCRKKCTKHMFSLIRTKYKANICITTTRSRNKTMPAPSKTPLPLLITTSTLPCGHDYIDFCGNFCAFYSFTFPAHILKQTIQFSFASC